MRVIPVRKNDGRIMLNDKVYRKSKNSFLIIEDCPLRLGNKTVFTLLDMRDSFHQIEVHPEYTKFFAFAIPDGQFEYT